MLDVLTWLSTLANRIDMGGQLIPDLANREAVVLCWISIVA